jgi:putative PEP-CTERM system histidine kinase
MDLAVATYSTAAAAFAALIALLAWQGGEVRSYRSMALAAACTVLWAGWLAVDFWRYEVRITLPGYVLEMVRSTAWLIFLADALFANAPERRKTRRLVRTGIVAAGLTSVLLALVPEIVPTGIRVTPNTILIGNLILAIFGLALTENLLRNVPSDARWNLKFLCFGVGAIFGYDFFLYSQALLLRQIDGDLFAARGITNALAVSLLAVSVLRSKGPAGRAPRRELVVSHSLVFHSAALLGTGAYLLVMAAVGYYIRQYGGTWGGVLQMTFLFGAGILLVVSFSSGTVRGYLKTFVGKHFFKYKYDYREEWLRFIRTTSEAEQNVQLPERVIQAVCDIFDSPEGGVWLQQQERLALKSTWNLSRWNLDAVDAQLDRASPLIAFLERTHSVIDIDELRRDPRRYEGTALPAWLEQLARAWLIVPLVHHDELRGMLILGKPRAPKEVDWEDRELLGTLGQQAASYLAEYELGEALAEARQFEAFNKRFAFVIHDIKNLVSRLSLIVSNAAKHRHDAAFQDDMIRTIESSIDKMKKLLLQLHGQQAQPGQGQPVEIERLLQAAVASQKGRGPTIAVEVKTPALAVQADEERLRRVIGHLIQNAVEAAPRDGAVNVRLKSEGKMAVLEVEDNGPGMDPEFVREKLFKPFKTTKGEGYGIGVYETNEFARAAGGRLDVFSQPGRGTIMKMSLPLVRPAAL